MNTEITKEFLETSYSYFVSAKKRLETDSEYMKGSALGRETLKTLTERAIKQLSERLEKCEEASQAVELRQ